jgi:hypothetical protein
MEEFRRNAENYIRAAQQYLGEATDPGPVSCQGDTEISLITQIARYYLRCLRARRRQLEADGQAVG